MSLAGQIQRGRVTRIKRDSRRSHRALRFDLAADIDRGWRFFWSRRGGCPAVSNVWAQTKANP
jgi:hypothetical protein